ncbi:helix-turn-helix domain-containing protein [Mycobacteroides chelonae]|uniref:helix-turn-helix domain-containing protein n=1 Tax=Mycobacteroides chelonae TaxID=1774 RepID=UPI000994222F|nr:helix-turn-helix domain-containing protein [Mycobacteroides chelonae]
MTAYDPAAEGLRARFRREEAALHADGFVTVAEAMERLGVSRNAVNRMIGDGRLHAVRWAHRWVTRPEWIDEVPRTRKAAAAWRRANGWLSVAEAAAELGITRQALQVRIQRGTQFAVRAGADAPVPGAWLIREADVQGRAA